MKRILGMVLAIMMIVSIAIPVVATTEEKTEVVFWSFRFDDWNYEWTKARVEEFNADPDQEYYVTYEALSTDVFLEKITAALVSGETCDIMLGSYSGIPAWSGNFLALNDLIPQDAWDDLTEGALDLITYEGQYWAYPMYVEPAEVMYYRKDLLEEAGIAVPTTLDELLAAGAALTSQWTYGLGLMHNYSMWGWEMTLAGHWPITDDWSAPNCQDEGYVALINMYMEAIKSGATPEQALSAHDATVLQLCQDAYAIAISGSWGMQQILNQYPEMAEYIGVAAVPTNDGSNFQSSMGGWAMSILKDGSNPEGAAAFIYWLLGSDQERAASFFDAGSYANFPARTSVSEYVLSLPEVQENEWLQAILTDVIPYGVPEPNHPVEITNYMAEAIDEVLINGLTAEEALQQMADKITEYIELHEISKAEE